MISVSGSDNVTASTVTNSSLLVVGRWSIVPSNQSSRADPCARSIYIGDGGDTIEVRLPPVACLGAGLSPCASLVESIETRDDASFLDDRSGVPAWEIFEILICWDRPVACPLFLLLYNRWSTTGNSSTSSWNQSVQPSWS